MTKPLAGIRVIEIGNIIAGPLCGTLLADMGADVIKLEGRGGDMSRAIPPHQNGESISFAALNLHVQIHAAAQLLLALRPAAQDFYLLRQSRMGVQRGAAAVNGISIVGCGECARYTGGIERLDPG